MPKETQPLHVFSIDGALTIEVKRLRKRTTLGEVAEKQVWQYAIKHLGTTIFAGKDLVTDLYEPNTYAAALALFYHMPTEARSIPDYFDSTAFNVKQFSWFANMAELYRLASTHTYISNHPGVTLILSDGTVVPFNADGLPVIPEPKDDTVIPDGFELDSQLDSDLTES